MQSMSVLCPDSVVLGPAILNNYRFCFRFHADIEADVCSSVDGVLWQISDSDLSNLDIVEGFPDYYQRHQVEVIHNNRVYSSWVYIMSNSSGYQKPMEIYLQKCRQGYIDNNLPLTQIENALKL